MDRTQRVDPTRRVTGPAKERVNLALAAVAGALGVLVLFSAHEVLTGHPAVGATPAPTVRASPSPTPTPTERRETPKPGKGKDHD